MDSGASLPSTCPDARKRRVSYFYEPDIGDYDYGKDHPMKPKRIRMAHYLILKYDLHRRMDMSRPFPAAVDDIRGFHSPDYVEFLSSVSPNALRRRQTARSLKQFNFGDDCPVFDGLFDFCQASAGGSIGAAVKLYRQDADIAINWGGGLHHAKKSEASGFCYVNDIVLGILELLKVFKRVLYVDIDIHHGDGVEEAFYETDRVMTVSFHKFDGTFFPKTGKITDVGEASGKYYAVNVPLKDGLNDDNFRSLFRPIMQKVMDVYQPEAVVLQCGADSLSGDRLGSFNLSVKGHADCLRFLRSFNVPLMVLGGGGYTIENVARCWCYETAVAVDVELDNKLPTNEYYDNFGPDYTLHVEPSNMKNLNTQRDLEEIRNTLLDQLSKLPHVPSTQFKTMPLTTLVPEEREEDMEVRPEPRVWNGEHDLESDEEENDNPMRSLHNEAAYKENSDLSLHSAEDIVSQLARATIQEKARALVGDAMGDLEDGEENHQLELTQKELAEAKAKFEESDLTNRKLSTELSLLKDLIQHNQEEHNQLELTKKELAEAKAKLQESDLINEKLGVKLSQLKDLIQHNQEEHNQLELTKNQLELMKELAKAKAKLQESDLINEKLGVELSLLKDLIQHNQEELTKKELAEAKAKLQESDLINEKLSTELSLPKDLIQHSREEQHQLELMQKELAEAKAKLQESELTNEHHRQNIDRLASENRKLSAELSLLKDLIQHNQEVASQEKSDFMTLESLQNRIEDLETVIKNCNADLEVQQTILKSDVRVAMTQGYAEGRATGVRDCHRRFLLTVAGQEFLSTLHEDLITAYRNSAQLYTHLKDDIIYFKQQGFIQGVKYIAPSVVPDLSNIVIDEPDYPPNWKGESNESPNHQWWLPVMRKAATALTKLEELDPALPVSSVLKYDIFPESSLRAVPQLYTQLQITRSPFRQVIYVSAVMLDSNGLLSRSNGIREEVEWAPELRCTSSKIHSTIRMNQGDRSSCIG